MLRGRKTYLAGAALVAYGVFVYFQGQQSEGVRNVLEGLSIIFLRAGVSKMEVR